MVELVAHMIGRDLTELRAMSQYKASQAERKRAAALSCKTKDYGLAGAIAPFDLDLHEGEVIGLAGLLGSGRTETADLVFGIDKPTSGMLDGGKALLSTIIRR